MHQDNRKLHRLCTLMLGVLVLAGCVSLTPPEVRLTGLEPMPGTLLEQRVRVDLRLINQANQALTISGLDFDLMVNGRRLASGVSSQAIRLPALGEAQTSVTVSTSVLDLLQQLPALQRGGPIPYQIQGRLHLDRRIPPSIPFRHSGELTLP